MNVSRKARRKGGGRDAGNMAESMTIIPAGAGSGKTFRIKSDLTDLVRQKAIAPERILAVTFTEAASAELKERIRDSLLAAGMVEEALAVEMAYVSTIHGLGMRILSEHAFAAGTSPRPRALSEAERNLLIRQAMTQSRALDQVKSDLPRFGYLPGFGSDTSLEDEFRASVLAMVDLLRGLGDSGDDPALAKAALKRVRKLYGPVKGDPDELESALVAAVKALLKAFPEDLTEHASSDTARREFARDHNLLRRALRQGELARDWRLWSKLGKLRLSKRGSPTPGDYDELAGAVIEAAEGIAIHPGPLKDACDHFSALVHGAQEAMSIYAERKRDSGVIDYADMICDAERLLRCKPEILDALLAEIDCVVIDEFQDTNPVQFALLWRLAQAAKLVLVVGDTKQSIMGFQGADPRLSAALERQNPESCEPLDSNWRSDPRLMDLLNEIAGGLFGDAYVPLEARRPETGQEFAEVLRIPEGRASRKSRPEDHVAAHVVEMLEQKVLVADRESSRTAPEYRPVAARDIAVLCPTHAMASRYAHALTELGVPVRISTTGWLDSPAVMVARNALAFAADPGDLHAALSVLALGPPQIPLEDAVSALADGEIENLPELAGLRDLSEKAPGMPLDALLSRALEAARLREWVERLPDAAQAHANLLRLKAEVAEFMSAHREYKAAAGLHGCGAQVFLGWLESRRAERDFDRLPDPGQDMDRGVEIATWHSSKGREWPVVVVVGLDGKIGERPGAFRAEFESFEDLSGILDQARLIWTPNLALKEKTRIFVEDRRESAEADAKRLLYVVLTRARDRLVLEWPDFALKKIGEGEGPASHAEMLYLEAGVEPGASGLKAGTRTFQARVLTCDADPPDAPALANGAVDGVAAPRVAFGELRESPGTEAPRTPWRVSPSSLEDGAAPAAETRVVELAGPKIEVPAAEPAMERGTALHKALRVMLKRPDLRRLLPGATDLDDAALDAVQERASALARLLADEGYPEFDCEVPVQRRFPSGAEQNGVIDLVAIGKGKSLVLDHKSGTGEFAKYTAQLRAYADALAEIDGSAVAEIAIHWIDRGTVEFAPGDPAA